MVSLDVLREQIVSCTRCSMSREASPVPFQSAPGAQVMLVADQADAEAELLREPMADRAGRHLDNLLCQARLPHVHKTFLLKCQGRQRVKDALVCADWLSQEIAIVQPRVVVAMGKLAASVLLGVTSSSVKMEELAGQFRLAVFFDVQVGVWFSPFHVLNRGKEMDRRTLSFFEEVRKHSGLA